MEQALHADELEAPRISENLPLGHTVHEVDASDAYVPLGQIVHDDDPGVTAYLPAEQPLQFEEDPITSENLPLEHESQ